MGDPEQESEMHRLLLIGAGLTMLLDASVTQAQDTSSVPTAQPTVLRDTVRLRPRARSVEYSDWYSRRLTIHRIGSYTMLPLFGAEYYLGQKLIEGRASERERSVHVGIATAIGGLFAVNTVTGVWNLWDSRKDDSDRKRRYVHAALMLGADAGFALAAAVANDGGESGTHRAVALTSIGVSTVGTALMWFWR